MGQLGNGLLTANHPDAVSVYEAHLTIERRLGTVGEYTLGIQGNLAGAYESIGRHDCALRLRREVYSGTLRLHGDHHGLSLSAANSYTASLATLRRYEEARSLWRKTMPVARRVLGESNMLTLQMRLNYAEVLCRDPGSTLDDVREAVTTYEDVGRIARRVLGSAHPLAAQIERELQQSRKVLRAREGGDVSAVRADLEAMRTL
jgi:hypothetical protein